MRLSAVQFAAATDVAANLETITGLVEQAADGGADLVVLPEASMHDFGAPDLPLGSVAQPLDGDFVVALSDLARRVGVTLVAGMFEVSEQPERPFNTLVAISPDGRLQASYRKTHLYDSFGYRESDRLLAGEPIPVVVPVGDFEVGLMTCYDVRFPEFSRALVDAGADVLVVPAAWVHGPAKQDHWTTLLRARAIENTVYVVGAAQNGRSYTGFSSVVDPMGVVLAGLGDETGSCAAEAHLGRLAEIRAYNPSLANRRLGAVPQPSLR